MKAPQSTGGIYAVALLGGFVVLVLTWPIICGSQQGGGEEIINCTSFVGFPSPAPDDSDDADPKPWVSVTLSLVAFILAQWWLQRRARRPDGDVASSR